MVGDMTVWLMAADDGQMEGWEIVEIGKIALVLSGVACVAFWYVFDIIYQLIFKNACTVKYGGRFSGGFSLLTAYLAGQLSRKAKAHGLHGSWAVWLVA